MFVGYSYVIYSSDDGGAHWNHIDFPANPVSIQVNGDRLIAGSERDGVWLADLPPPASDGRRGDPAAGRGRQRTAIRSASATANSNPPRRLPTQSRAGSVPGAWLSFRRETVPGTAPIAFLENAGLSHPSGRVLPAYSGTTRPLQNLTHTTIPNVVLNPAMALKCDGGGRAKRGHRSERAGGWRGEGVGQSTTTAPVGRTLDPRP